MKSYLSVAVGVVSVLPTCQAWGSLGHMTVGYIAQKYLTTQTVTWAQGLLDNTNSSYVADVATWADSFRYTTAGKFSAPFHYIDANDSPPEQCNVDYNRDCGEAGCIVSAVANYTTRVQDTKLSKTQRVQALQFLIHFLGDVTQPLHDEAYEVGGNGITVKFDGASTNLHHIWDTEMPEKLVGGYQLSDASRWADQLSQEIDEGEYSSHKASWISMIDLSDVQGSVTKMAADANTFVCSYTLKPDVQTLEKEDLGGDYYKNAVPIFEEQIAKGGYRLAAWLNSIATGSTCL